MEHREIAHHNRGKNPYRKALPIDESLAILKKGTGTHFDSEVSEAFFSIQEEILSILRGNKDPPSKKGVQQARAIAQLHRYALYAEAGV